MTPAQALAAALSKPLSQLLGRDGAIVLTAVDCETLIRLAQA